MKRYKLISEDVEIHTDEVSVSTIGVAELHALRSMNNVLEEESADVEDNENSANHPLPSDIAP